MSASVRIGLLVLAVSLGLTNTVSAQTQDTYFPATRAALASAYEAAKEGKWQLAATQAQATNLPAALDMVEWMRVRDEDASDFTSASIWLRRHPGWPAERTVQRNAEKLMLPGQAPGFFTTRAPVTPRGTELYARHLRAAGQSEKARKLVTQAWLEMNFTQDEQKAFVVAFDVWLRPVDNARTERLLWDNRATETERMLSRLAGTDKALAATRAALLKQKRGVDGMIRRLPASAKAHPGLGYARAYWRRTKGRKQGVVELLRAVSKSNDQGNPDAWAPLRRRYVRMELDAKKYASAYRITSTHKLTAGADFADLEWLSGWIALTYLNDAALAQKHFERLWDGVNYPVSRARAAYWSGRAAERLGNQRLAQIWYNRADHYPESFYGQLALLKTGDAPLIKPRQALIPSNPNVQWREMMQVGFAFAAAGANKEANRFLKAAVKGATTHGHMEEMRRIALDNDFTHQQVIIGKAASQRGVFLPDLAYPRPPINHGQTACGKPAVDRAFALAIARQESQFDPKAKSSAGARGLMQLMPRTARLTAKKAGMTYSLSRLSDPGYNSHLGSCYLAQMLERFGGSKAMAAAAYNAGPSRVDAWLKAYGDPRKQGDIVDWIERIPFKETRNYVQRVIENYNTYRFLERDATHYKAIADALR